MPSRTLEDKVEELSKLVSAHAEQLQYLQRSLDGAIDGSSTTERGLGELKHLVIRLEQQVAELTRWRDELAYLADLKTEVAILRREVDKLEKTKEEWGRRAWAVAGPLVGAVVGAVMGYILHR